LYFFTAVSELFTFLRDIHMRNQAHLNRLYHFNGTNIMPGSNRLVQKLWKPASIDCLRESAGMLTTAFDDHDEGSSLRSVQAIQKRAAPGHVEPEEDHIDGHHINSLMRAIVVDWMTDLCHVERIQSREVFEIAVHAVDVAIATMVVTKERLQMLAVAALSLTCKFLSRGFPDREWWAYMSDGAVETIAIIEAERKLMKVLEFNIAFVVPCHFIDCWRHVFELDEHSCCEAVSRFLVEIAMMNVQVVAHRADEIAAASLYIAMETCSRKEVSQRACRSAGCFACGPFSSAQWKVTTFTSKTLAPTIAFLRSAMRTMVEPSETATHYHLQAASKQVQCSGALKHHHSCLSEFVAMQLAMYKPLKPST
jgi:hypothetical protein